MTASTRSGNRDRRALQAVATQFFANGAIFASVIPRLPEVRDQIGVSVSRVGLLLSLAAAAGLIGSLLVSPAINRWGSRSVLLGAGLILATGMPVVGLADSQLVLLLGLLILQVFDVPVDVAMNLQGSWLSKRRHTPVMNRLHGLWSFGTVVGGLSSSWIAGSGISLRSHLLIAGAVMVVLVTWVGQGVLRVDEHPEPDTAAAGVGGANKLGLALGLFVVVGFFSVAIESTSLDWAAFRLADDLSASTGVAPLGYVAVAVGMTAGRMAGDWVSVRVSPSQLITLACLLAAAGLAAATLIDNTAVALIGYAIAGVGVATMLPTMYDRAAQHRGRSGAGLGALTAGVRAASLMVPLGVGALAGTSLSVGQAVAIVSVPAALGFAVAGRQLLAQQPAVR